MASGWGGLSSELLGFASDARVLIVNCDDLGMYDAVNMGVVESIERGVASSCSLVLDFGLAPTLLDWHCLADGGRPDIMELTLRLAAEYRLAARVWLPPARHQARSRGLAVVDHDFVDSFASTSPAKPTDTRSCSASSRWPERMGCSPRGVDARGRENR